MCVLRMGRQQRTNNKQVVNKQTKSSYQALTTKKVERKTKQNLEEQKNEHKTSASSAVSTIPYSGVVGVGIGTDQMYRKKTTKVLVMFICSRDRGVSFLLTVLFLVNLLSIEKAVERQSLSKILQQGSA